MCDLSSRAAHPKTVLDAGSRACPSWYALAAVSGDIRCPITEPTLEDPAVLALAQRVVPVPDASTRLEPEIPPAGQVLRETDARWSPRAAGVPGTVDAPLTGRRHRKKFGDCRSGSPGALADRPEQLQAVKPWPGGSRHSADAIDLVRGWR